MATLTTTIDGGYGSNISEYISDDGYKFLIVTKRGVGVGPSVHCVQMLNEHGLPLKVDVVSFKEEE